MFAVFPIKYVYKQKLFKLTKLKIHETNERTQALIFSIVILFGGTACDNANDERFSSTEEFTVEGDASSIEIPMTRTNWIVASVMYPDGGIMTDENGYPLKLEGMGTVRFHWGSITRDKAKSLTIQLNDNFAGKSAD